MSNELSYINDSFRMFPTNLTIICRQHPVTAGIITSKMPARFWNLSPKTITWINHKYEEKNHWLKTVLDPSRWLNELADIDWFCISFNWIIIGITTSLHCNGNIRQVQNLIIIAYINIEMIIQINLMVNCQLCLNIFGYINSANLVTFLVVFLP